MEIGKLIWLEKENEKITCSTFSYRRDWSFLADSIKKFGILNPVLVRRKQDQTWEIISGKGRFDCGFGKIPAIEINCDDLEALNIYVHENKQRGFNSVERALIISRLRDVFGFSLEKISDDYATLIDLPLGIEVISNHIDLLKLPNFVLDKIAEGLIEFKNALLLLDFNDVERKILLEIASKYRLNTNKQKEIWSYIWEICKRDSISVTELMKKDVILSIENSPNYLTALKKTLQNMLYPCLNYYEDAFDKIVKECKFTNPIFIEHSQSFEKDEICVKFSFNKIEDLKKIIKNFEKFEKNFEKLLQIVKLREL